MYHAQSCEARERRVLWRYAQSESCSSASRFLVATTTFAPTRVEFVTMLPCVTAAFRWLAKSHAPLRRSAGDHTLGCAREMKTTHLLQVTVVTRLIVSY